MNTSPAAAKTSAPDYVTTSEPLTTTLPEDAKTSAPVSVTAIVPTMPPGAPAANSKATDPGEGAVYALRLNAMLLDAGGVYAI